MFADKFTQRVVALEAAVRILTQLQASIGHMNKLCRNSQGLCSDSNKNMQKPLEMQMLAEISGTLHINRQYN